MTTCTRSRSGRCISRGKSLDNEELEFFREKREGSEPDYDDELQEYFKDLESERDERQ